MINIAHKKGYVLMLALLFMIVAIITSVGIYAYSGHIVREVKIDKKASAKGYYYAVAGARYAKILLKDPVANFGFSSVAFDGETKTITIIKTDSLGADLKFSGNDTIKITAAEYNAGTPSLTPWAPDSYNVKVVSSR